MSENFIETKLILDGLADHLMWHEAFQGALARYARANGTSAAVAATAVRILSEAGALRDAVGAQKRPTTTEASTSLSPGAPEPDSKES